MKQKKRRKQYVVCVKNSGYSASLETRKIYQLVLDSRAERHSMVRIVDESGEGYLYPEKFFVSIELPQSVAKVLALAA